VIGVPERARWSRGSEETIVFKATDAVGVTVEYGLEAIASRIEAGNRPARAEPELKL